MTSSRVYTPTPCDCQSFRCVDVARTMAEFSTPSGDGGVAPDDDEGDITKGVANLKVDDDTKPPPPPTDPNDQTIGSR